MLRGHHRVRTKTELHDAAADFGTETKSPCVLAVPRSSDTNPTAIGNTTSKASLTIEGGG